MLWSSDFQPVVADNNPDPEPPQHGAAEQPEQARFCFVILPALRKDYETQASLEGREEVLEPRLLDNMDPRWSSSFQEIVAPNNERYPRPDGNETASSETLAIDPGLREATPPRKVFDLLSEPPKRPELLEPRLANRWISERRLPPLQPQQKCWLAEDRQGQGPRLFYYTPTLREQEHYGVAYPQDGQEPPDRWQYQPSPYFSPPKQSGFYSGNSEASARRV